MTKGLARSLARGPVGKVRSEKISVGSLAMTVDGATGVGWGTVQVGDLPEGNILFLGAVAYPTVTEGDAGITATFDGDFAVGTAPATSATLSGAQVDVIGSTALATAVASVSSGNRGEKAGAAMFDNTDGSLELNFQLLIDDGDISADDADVTVSLDLYVSYVVMGDD